MEREEERRWVCEQNDMNLVAVVEIPGRTAS